MKDIESLVKQVITWNAERYNQQYDHSLSEKLLLEELHELYTSEDWVDILDSIGDITFVSIGVMWKLGIHFEDIIDLFERMQPGKTLEYYNQESDKYICYICEKHSFKLYHSLQLKMLTQAMFITSYTMLNRIGMLDKFLAVLEIICISNNTKAIPKQKVLSNIKANINKGESFVPPTEALIKLLKSVRNEKE